ncbi:MAG: helix-turn-helix transcriptional regulator [Nitrospinae bacterium]|nr:helix-turn-helix transcriptional regulator [Nitrospinota bacterium]
MADIKSFGLRVKTLRALRKLTQEQVAEKCGINSKYVSRIEMGYQFPSFDILVKLCAAMNVEMQDLFNFAHTGKSAKEYRKGLNELVNEADEEKLELAYRIIKAVVR